MPSHAKTQTSAPVLPEIGPQDDATTVLARTDEEDLEESLAFKSLMEVRKKRRRRRIIIGAVAGVAVLGVALRLILGSMAPEEDVIEIPEVTAFVERGDFVDEVGATGAAQPVSSVVVMPEVEGVIETVEVVEGQTVQEGDVLFTLRNESLDRAITEAGEQVSSAQSALDAAYREYNNARDAYGDTQGLSDRISDAERRVEECQEAYNEAAAKVKAKETELANTTQGAGQGSADAEQEETDEARKLNEELEELYSAELQAQSALASAQETLSELKAKSEGASSASSAVDSASDAISSAKAALASAQRTYDDAVAMAKKRTVTAPKSGSVLVMNAVVGMDLGSASGSGAGELVRIADFSQMRVAIQINEVDISRIAVGQKAKVTFSALPDVTCDAVVESVASVSGSGSEEYGGGVVTYKVELLIEHPDTNIKPGMSANVTITTQEVTDTLIVPTTAIGQDVNGAPCVTVVTRGEDGEIADRVQRPVTVVAQTSSDAAVTADLQEGDEILIGMMGDEGDYGVFGDEGEYEDGAEYSVEVG